jgi:two-component system LytT family sensor kinase
MKKSFDIKLVKFYLWVGVGYFILSVLTTLGSYPGRFFSVVFNNMWGVGYLIPLNFILFEYTIPFVLRKRKTIIYNILLAIFLLFVHLILYSYGSYVWRLLGIQLHVYTPLKTFSSLGHAYQNQMGYSVGSIFFFGIIRNIYNYIKLK